MILVLQVTLHEMCVLCQRFLIYWSSDVNYAVRRVNYGLTSWKSDLLEKLVVAQLVKKFSTFYGTQTLVALFSRPRLECDKSIFLP